jgi:hypothetical protein
MKIFLCVLAVLLLGGIISENDLSIRRLCVICFCAVLVCATVLHLAPLFLG